MSSIKKNFGYQAFYEVLILMLPLFTSPYISRVLGAEGVGVNSYYYSIANYFVLFAMLGIKNHGNRLISTVRNDKERLNKEFSSLLLLHISFSVVVLAAYIVYCLCAVEPQDRLYALIQGIYVVAAVFDINWLFFGLEQFKLTVTMSSIVKILTVASIFIFVREKSDLWKYVLIMALGNAISQSLVWIYLNRYVKCIRVKIADLIVHIKPLLILFIPVLAVSIYKIMDKIMLGQMTSKTEVGYYENAEKIITIFNTVISAFGTVMLPRMNHLFALGDTKTGFKYLNRSMQYILIFTYALAFGTSAIAQKFACWFWGDEFIGSGAVLIVLVFTLPFVAFASVIRMQYLIPMHKDKEYIISVIGGAVINVVINILLIPQFNALGAAIGTICAEVFVCIFQCFCVHKEVPVFKYMAKSIPFAFAGLIMFAVVTLLGWLLPIESLFISLLIQIISGGLIYSVLTLVILILKKDELVSGIQKRIKGKKNEIK